MAAGGQAPELEVTAELDRRTAKVWVFRDRIEWMKNGRSLAATAALAAATEGMSSLDGGGSGEDQPHSISIGSISSITAQRVGLHTRLVFETTGRHLVIDLPRGKAAKVEQLVRSLMRPAAPGGA